MVIRSEGSPFTAEFDLLVQQQLDKWKVPGLSIAVVHGSSTYSKAYGIAEFPNKPMTTNSLFSTCSTTKAFTAAAMSMVIDESKNTSNPIRWDTPIHSLIPDDFALADDAATLNTTIEDALSHRSGLAGDDTLMSREPCNASIRETVRKLRHLPFTLAPRTTFSYNNNMYIVVSHILEQLTGQDLGTVLRQRIWDPLGMKDVYFDIQELCRSPRGKRLLARGYTWDEDTQSYIAEPYMKYRPTTGAGAIVSNVLEYTKWLRAMIYKTGPMSPQGHAAMVEPRTIITDTSDIVGPPAPYHAYGLGWFAHSWRGEPLYWHSGSWPGFGIMVGFLPGRQFGFVMMGNTIQARKAELELYSYLLDKIVGYPWNPAQSVISQRASGVKPSSESTGSAMQRLFPSLPSPVIPHSLPLESYAGHYNHPGSSLITFEIRNGRLIADFRDRVGMALFELHHASGEFFLGHWFSGAELGAAQNAYIQVQFRVDYTGAVQAVGLDLQEDSSAGKLWYQRKI
ncbi:beta-lactamase/transpeptidase-like protein [Aspergillus candidus]|uniref:Beta-lactamase/transpeptidase-like protein n=1 Tax=Aspergillus candidus TaxID=41067 RepID=A0A2I2FHC8_ASPCN|nr:beta-lactamase/transpeptidase-like protein [Aspergillus candidus]PLB40036.1 beta-lactamase/transpeptidase-like protein [Aspergillus candidus]